MSLKIFQSIPEALTYGLLLLLIILNVCLWAIVKKDTQEIENQQVCLVSLFFKPDRASLTLTNISGCSRVIIKH